MLRLALSVTLALLVPACDSQVLRDNQQRWREAECDKILDTHRRERCLKEANEKK